MAGETRPHKPAVFSAHARQRMKERGTNEEEVREAIRTGELESAQRGLSLFRLNLEFNAQWGGKHYNVKQVAPVVSIETDRVFVITVYTFYF